MLPDLPPLGPRMRYVDLPPAELDAVLVVLARSHAQLGELQRRLERTDLPAAFFGPCAMGLFRARDALLTELRALSTELWTRQYRLNDAAQ